MNSQKIIKQIRKLFNREVENKTEVDELNLWYQSLNEKTVIPENLSDIKSDSWITILEKTHPVERRLENKKFPFLKNWLWKVAIFLGICFTSYGLLNPFSEEEWPVKLAAGVYTNDIGKVSTFFLPDGSEIWLSTGSELEYAEDFSRNREVKLTGEAFFKVKRNPDFPFQITTGTFSTVVLGTSFNLKSYEENEIELSVYSGRVMFFDQQSRENSATLVKGERISWMEEKGISAIQYFDTGKLPDWRQGMITFENAGLVEIQSTLKKWYKIPIKIVGNKKNCHYSGEFNQASLEQILETLSYALNITYELNDTYVIIYATPCKIKSGGK